MLLSPYYIVEPKVEKVPIVISVPHSGIDFPEELKEHYIPTQITKPDDTDWFVHKLYNFASAMGITLVHARYSRWVIDLNRDPESKPLYNDGRIITSLTPSKDFFGNSIYKNEEFIPSQVEIERRLENYYWPYYKKIEYLLSNLKAKFGHALLWDAHSIRRLVPTIQQSPFPDLVLGSDDKKSASEGLINQVLNSLQTCNYNVKHNTPFKGGHITRYFGNPENNTYALQLEMAKDLYMDNLEQEFDVDKANKVRSVLKGTFQIITENLSR